MTSPGRQSIRRPGPRRIATPDALPRLPTRARPRRFPAPSPRSPASPWDASNLGLRFHSFPRWLADKDLLCEIGIRLIDELSVYARDHRVGVSELSLNKQQVSAGPQIRQIAIGV